MLSRLKRIARKYLRFHRSVISLLRNRQPEESLRGTLAVPLIRYNLIQNNPTSWPTSSCPPSWLSLLTFYAELHADLYYRTTVSRQSVLPDLQLGNRNSETNSARFSSRPRMSVGSFMPVIPNCSD